MPVLPSLPQAEIKQFYMPSTAHLPEAEQGWVKMDVSPLNIQDFLAIEDDGEGNNAARGMKVFAERIKEWNFTEEDGTEIPITNETIVRLGPSNLGYLSAQLPKDDLGQSLTIAQKKS